MGWTYLANALKTEKKWNDAAEAYQKIIALEPNPKNKIEDHYTLGLIYATLQRLPRAKESFEAALALTKCTCLSMEAILSIYLKQKAVGQIHRPELAFHQPDPEGRGDKSVFAPLSARAGYRDFLEDRQKAVIEFQAVLKLDPDNIQSRIELAELYAKDSNTYPSAIREHQEIISRQLFRLESYHQMGGIYEMMGKLDEAFCCYKVLEFFPRRQPRRDHVPRCNNAQVTQSFQQNPDG